MNLNDRKQIIRPLFYNEEFLRTLTRDFGDQELSDIYYEYRMGLQINMPWSWMPLGEFATVGQDFERWLEDEIREEGIDVLTIRSFKDGLAQGRKGTLAFRARFGLVMSCDYSDEHIEPFESELFSPWNQKDFSGKSILVTSEIYGREEILALLVQMFDIEECTMTIIGRMW